jgi:hypothetical protein
LARGHGRGIQSARYEAGSRRSDQGSPAALAQDPERLARFEREAKVLAALNHPNIAQIYGLEQRALVMELVPGQTLKGPLPLETALILLICGSMQQMRATILGSATNRRRGCVARARFACVQRLLKNTCAYRSLTVAVL